VRRRGAVNLARLPVHILYQQVLHAKVVAASGGAARKALDFFAPGNRKWFARMGGMGVVS